MDFKEFQEQDAPALFEKIAQVQGRLVEKDTQLRATKKEVDRLRLQITELSEEMAGHRLLESIEGAAIPEWLTPTDTDKVHHATPFLVLSDLHLDEVVDVEEMSGLNKFNREIAEMRFQRVIDGTIEQTSDYITGLTYDGIICALAGDIITGIIHEELAETNEATVPETIIHWSPIIAAGLKRLADEYGNVFVPCVDGNHDRMYQKMRMKKRATSSFAWIIYNSIAMLCADDDRISFNIPKSPELLFDVYGTTVLLDHGDKFRGGGGVGGIYPPMLKWLTRKRNIPGREFDFAVIGHWHQLIYHSDVFVNGSLKGYDEYARNSAFGFERPQQLLFFVTPENGVTIKTQVFADDPEAEGWA